MTRIAPVGSLDLVNERYNDVTVAVVDGIRCAKVRQKIRGPFRKPEVEQVSVLQTAAGPLLSLFKQAGKLFGGRCEGFYAGNVTNESGIHWTTCGGEASCSRTSERGRGP